MGKHSKSGSDIILARINMLPDKCGEKSGSKLHDSDVVDNKEEKRTTERTDLVSPNRHRSCHQETVYIS